MPDELPNDKEFAENRSDRAVVSEDMLPKAIITLRTIKYLAGALLIIFGLGLCIALREAGILIFCLFGMWFLYSGFALSRDYNLGRITGARVKCVNVRISRFGDYASVAFQTLSDEGDSQYLQFRIYGKRRSEDFIQNGLYRIYYYAKHPGVLTAYEQIPG